MENPKTESRKMEKPKTEKPKTEKPKMEKPKTEKPKTEKPKTANPKNKKRPIQKIKPVYCALPPRIVHSKVARGFRLPEKSSVTE